MFCLPSVNVLVAQAELYTFGFISKQHRLLHMTIIWAPESGFILIESCRHSASAFLILYMWSLCIWQISSVIIEYNFNSEVLLNF